MAQTANQQRAAQAVDAWLAAHEFNRAWLVAKTKADPGTIGDFLNGLRWPKTGTQGKIERALGWEPGTIRRIEYGEDPPAVSAGSQDATYVAAPGDVTPEDATLADVVREIRAMRERVDELERRMRP